MTPFNEHKPPLPIHNGDNSADKSDDPDTKCGVGSFTPQFMQVFARIGAFVGVFSGSALLTSSLFTYINSQVSMLEKQFGFSSAQTGFLMACNDIGYLSGVIFSGYIAKKVHIPRGFCVSTILLGASGIVCAIPYFVQDRSVFSLDDTPSSDGSNVTRSSMARKRVPMCTLGNISSSLGDMCSATSEEGAYNLEQLWIKKFAFAMISIGIVFQGVGISPRAPFLTLYIDDAVSKQKTGFYMGIIIGTAIFGPALAYFLGGVFSKIYITLESVNISPSDPRWIGAWWLGFVLFGIGVIVLSFPIMLFPKKLRSKSRQKEAEMKEKERKPTQVKQRTLADTVRHEVKDYTTSILRIIKNPAYVLLNLSTLVGVIGAAGTFAFTPKYIASQFTVPLWKANMIMAGCSIMALSIGSFIGGLITRKIKMTPTTTCKLLMLFYAVNTTSLVCGFFLGCDQPTIYGDNASHKPSNMYQLTEEHCNSNCNCRDDTYFPICGDDGRSYFSPCHAGCTTQRKMEFNNCTCIQSGHAVAGLCDQGCSTKLYIYATITFIEKLATAFKIIPTFIAKLRAVEERDRAVGAAFQSFISSSLGWMPGPVIFGAIIDGTCTLWKYTCGERQSCKLYDIVYFRNALHAYGSISSALAGMLIGCLYMYFKVSGRDVWLGQEEQLNARMHATDMEKELCPPMTNDDSNDEKAILGEESIRE